MTREDPGKRGKEYMVDETGCGGTGTHSFCCPADRKRPKCGWYTHNNGACDNKCPSGTVEVGSNEKYCRKGYQAACCTTDSPSMKLYSKCEWGSWPNCDSQRTCPSSKSTTLALSTTGSGGSDCDLRGYRVPVNSPEDWVVQERRFCCDTKNENESFDDCEWFTSQGPTPDGARDSWCHSGCPNSRVRVAMDGNSQECRDKGGARARCCVPRNSETILVENEDLERYRVALRAYMKDPKCPSGGSVFDKRTPRAEAAHDDRSVSVIEARADKTEVKYTQALLLALLTTTRRNNLYTAMEDLWNSEVTDKFEHLRIPELKDFVEELPEYGTSGPEEVSQDIVCSPNYWNRRSGGGTGLFDCAEDLCPLYGCDDTLARRDVMVEWSARGMTPRSMHAERFILEKRISAPRPYSVTIRSPDGSETLSWTIALPGVCASFTSPRPSADRKPIIQYRSISELEDDDTRQDEVVGFESEDDCGNTALAHYSLPSTYRYQGIVSMISSHP